MTVDVSACCLDNLQVSNGCLQYCQPVSQDQFAVCVARTINATRGTLFDCRAAATSNGLTVYGNIAGSWSGAGLVALSLCVFKML